MTSSYSQELRLMMDLLSWSDGTKSLLEISEICGVAIWDTYPIIEQLVTHNLIELNYTKKET